MGGNTSSEPVPVDSGSDQDVEKVHNLCKKLSYNVVIKQNLSKDEVRKALSQVRKELNTGSYDFFILFSMSHGDKDDTLYFQGEEIVLEEMLGGFIDGSMENFVGRPRMFFIQACRGRDKEWDTVTDEFKTILPTDSDLLIAFPTTPGYAAFRPNTGTVFIQKLLDVWEKNHRAKHLETMLTMVKREVAQESIERCGKNIRQMPCTWSTLTKEFYLRPNNI